MMTMRNFINLRVVLSLLTGFFLLLSACARDEPSPAKKPLARVEGERIRFSDVKAMPALLDVVQVQSNA